MLPRRLILLSALLVPFVQPSYARSSLQPPQLNEKEGGLSILIQDPDGGMLFQGSFEIETLWPITQPLSLEHAFKIRDPDGLVGPVPEEAREARLQSVFYKLHADAYGVDDSLFASSEKEIAYALDLEWNLYWVRGREDDYERIEVEEFPLLGGYQISVIGTASYWNWGAFQRVHYEENDALELMTFRSPCGRSFTLKKLFEDAK